MSERRLSHHLVLRSVKAPVDEGETEGEALARAAVEIPAFRERAEHIKRQRETGYPDAIPAEDVDRFLAELRAKEERPSDRRAVGDSGDVRVRMPRKLHRELAEQAAREGVSLNTII